MKINLMNQENVMVRNVKWPKDNPRQTHCAGGGGSQGGWHFEYLASKLTLKLEFYEGEK